MSEKQEVLPGMGSKTRMELLAFGIITPPPRPLTPDILISYVRTDRCQN